MRVLFITHEQNLNGASKSMLNLIDELKGRVEYYVVVPFKDGPVVDELNKRNIPYYYFPMKRWMKGNRTSAVKWLLVRGKWYLIGQFQNRAIARKLEGIIDENGIDLVHTNVSVLNIGALLHKSTGIPHVWHIREFGQEDFGIYPKCSYRAFYKTIDEGATTVITVSQALGDKYKTAFKQTHPTVVYNGVGRENVIDINDKTPCFDRPVNFLIAGTVQEGKGQQIAMKAAALLISEGENDFNLYIAGRGKDSWLNELRKLSNGHIVFLGQVNDMPKLRQGMDVELVCSKSEAFGRVTVEAMMGCMPVIGSNSGGTPELIEDGVTGCLFENGNAEELAERMKYFIHNRERIREMGVQAQKYAVSHFAIEICAENVLKEYQNALSEVGGVLRNIFITDSCVCHGLGMEVMAA